MWRAATGEVSSATFAASRRMAAARPSSGRCDTSARSSRNCTGETARRRASAWVIHGPMTTEEKTALKTMATKIGLGDQAGFEREQGDDDLHHAAGGVGDGNQMAVDAGLRG